jgi:uncharacterized RmlC-like cupin family protein
MSNMIAGEWHGVKSDGGGRRFVVQGSAGYRAEQGSDYQPGVSTETVGSKAIWLGIITLPPGRRTKAHVHEHHETALYEKMHPGDYLYVPSNVLHVGVNRGVTPAVFVGSRNEATAQESVVMRPEMDARVP